MHRAVYLPLLLPAAAAVAAVAAGPLAAGPLADRLPPVSALPCRIVVTARMLHTLTSPERQVLLARQRARAASHYYPFTTAARLACVMPKLVSYVLTCRFVLIRPLPFASTAGRRCTKIDLRGCRASSGMRQYFAFNAHVRIPARPATMHPWLPPTGQARTAAIARPSPQPGNTGVAGFLGERGRAISGESMRRENGTAGRCQAAPSDRSRACLDRKPVDSVASLPLCGSRTLTSAPQGCLLQ
jgi:hypothetical protein